MYEKEHIQIKRYEEVEINKLIPYENNAKMHPKEQVQKIAHSIQEFGFINPVLIDGEYNIIAGHGRILGAKELNMKKVPCLFIDDLTPEQQRAYILADNKLTELGEWNLEILKDELTALDNLDFDVTLTGFSLDDIVFDIDEQYEIEEDEYELEVPEEPKAKLGDIFQLGNHRLMCGDSTNIEDVKKLCDGVEIDLLITDPPYNVNYEGGTKDKLTIKNDNMENDKFHEFLYRAFYNANEVLKDGASFYVWYASKEVVNFHTAIEETGLSVKQELIWNKNSLVIGRQDYQWKHEPCLYGWKETSPHHWFGDRKQTTVIDWDRPTKSDLHPTMKPIGLFDYQIKNSSKSGDNILDLFGGSGTTIMACEQNGRKAYTMEFDPCYVDVIINRWEQHTGRKAVKLNDNL